MLGRRNAAWPMQRGPATTNRPRLLWQIRHFGEARWTALARRTHGLPKRTAAGLQLCNRPTRAPLLYRETYPERGRAFMGARGRAGRHGPLHPSGREPMRQMRIGPALTQRAERSCCRIRRPCQGIPARTSPSNINWLITCVHELLRRKTSPLFVFLNISLTVR